jgi:general stress protein 26
LADLKQTILDKMSGMNLWSLATVTEENKPWVRYVSPTLVEPDLTIWVATFAGSRKVAQIKTNPEVHLTMGMYEVAMQGSYVQVQARAEILDDVEEKKKHYGDHLSGFFSGPEDPNFVLLKLQAYRIEYNDMESMEPQVWEG